MFKSNVKNMVNATNLQTPQLIRIQSKQTTGVKTSLVSSEGGVGSGLAMGRRAQTSGGIRRSSAVAPAASK